MPPIRRLNSQNGPSGWTQPSGKISPSKTISASAMQGTGIVSPSASGIACALSPPAKVNSFTPKFALNVDATSSAGWVPMETEIGKGFFLCNARSANFRKLFGVTMSMPVMFFSLSIIR